MKTAPSLEEQLIEGFHSISFPSEWESRKFCPRPDSLHDVSIQLVFPASGKVGNNVEQKRTSDFVSIQLVFPASGKDSPSSGRPFTSGEVSIQLVFPASGKVNFVASPKSFKDEFPFN